MNRHMAIGLITAFLLAGCSTTINQVLDAGGGTQLQKRSYESRTFDTGNRETVLRGVVTTLQDMGFVIDRTDLALGVVSATKLDQHQTRITVSVHNKGADQVLVRANAEFDITPIDDPRPYQLFFAALEKTLFLTAHTGE